MIRPFNAHIFYLSKHFLAFYSLAYFPLARDNKGSIKLGEIKDRKKVRLKGEREGDNEEKICWLSPFGPTNLFHIALSFIKAMKREPTVGENMRAKRTKG